MPRLISSNSGQDVNIAPASGRTLKINNSTAGVDTILDEDNMASDDPNALATQQSIKAYVDASSVAPVGTMIDFAGTSLPTNYLECDGSAVSRATYSSLFTAIGTTWGVGDGSTTFNLPDARRSTAVGSGGTGTAELGNAVGDTGGAETHTLTIDEMPAHAHPNSVNTFGSSTTTGSGSVGTGSTGAAGGDQPHNNIQPSYVVLKCIKYQ